MNIHEGKWLNGLNCSGVTYMYFEQHPRCSLFHEHSKNENYFLNDPSIFFKPNFMVLYD